MLIAMIVSKSRLIKSLNRILVKSQTLENTGRLRPVSSKFKQACEGSTPLNSISKHLFINQTHGTCGQLCYYIKQTHPSFCTTKTFKALKIMTYLSCGCS